MSTDPARNDETNDNSLTHLVTDIYTRFLTANGTQRLIADQLKRAENNETRHLYYQASLLYQALLDNVLLTKNACASTNYATWLEGIRQRLVADECSDYRLITDPLHINSIDEQDQSTRPLGVQPSDPLIGRDVRHLAISKEMTIEFEGWLEQWLVNLSHTVAQIANIDNDDSDDHSMEIPPSLEQLENIVEDVEQRVAACLELRQRCDAMEMQMINETWSCVQIEEETLNLMLERVADPQSTEVLTAFSDYFSGVADNIKRKLNVQKAQVLRQIYSGHAPDALRCIRDKLLMQQAEIQKAFSEDNAKLHEYQSAGVEYVQIANEHGELLDAIKEVEEDINRIKIV